MPSKEQIAHDLTIVYLSNRYGVDVAGSIHATGDQQSLTSNVSTKRLPDMDEKHYDKIGTGQKGFLGLEKKTKVENGYRVDPIFREMIAEYKKAYSRFIELLEMEGMK